ncbi:MAG: hypothetical protein HYZ53_15265 [Planctomycetes bacterium]|nr:hypothetical protein [Planctomycetota bacterium]
MLWLQRIRRIATSALLLSVATAFFLVPGLLVVEGAFDPALDTGEVPDCAFRWHQSLAPRYEAWARERVVSGRAARLGAAAVSSEEWPLFGTLFFLLATEELQAAYENDPARSDQAPAAYARHAVEACAALLADPGHATWVRAKYGNRYLHHDDVFYRYLLIHGFTAYQKLTGKRTYEDILRDQVETLAAELAASPHLLLEDYPMECYPNDVLWAVAGILRADRLLGTDHAGLATRLLATWRTTSLDPATGLPPYSSDAEKGTPLEGARGCGNSGILVFAPELDPIEARRWYDAYERGFWQRKWLFDGFREFPRTRPIEWFADVDAGPVVAGHGVAACAFGIGAARANGRFDHARTLAAEALVFAWPLPDGSLLTPRLLSDATDAPLLGEAGLLFVFTRRPAHGVAATSGGDLPPLFWLLLSAYFGLGGAFVYGELRRWRRWRREGMAAASEGRATAGFAAWATLWAGAAANLLLGPAWVSVLVLLVSVVLPERIAGSAVVAPADRRGSA